MLYKYYGRSYLRRKVFFVFALLIGVQNLFSQAGLTGMVTDGKDALEFASLRIYRNKELITGTITDQKGIYYISLEPGIYDVEVLYAGFQSKKLLGVKVREGKTKVLNIELSSERTLAEAEITDFKIPLRDPFMSGKGLIDFSEKPPQTSPQKNKKQNKKANQK